MGLPVKNNTGDFKACISNTKTVKELTLAFFCISPTNIPLMLVQSNSTDPHSLKFCGLVFYDNNMVFSDIVLLKRNNVS